MEWSSYRSIENDLDKLLGITLLSRQSAIKQECFKKRMLLSDLIQYVV
jgi:hypothetical protein